MQDDPPQGVTAAPDEDDIMKWNAVIFGYVVGVHEFACSFCRADSSTMGCETPLNLESATTSVDRASIFIAHLCCSIRLIVQS